MTSQASQYRGTSSNSTNWFPTAPSAIASLEGDGDRRFTTVRVWSLQMLTVGWERGEQTQGQGSPQPTQLCSMSGSQPRATGGLLWPVDRGSRVWDPLARSWERAVGGWHLLEATSTRDVRQPVGSSFTRMMPLSRVTEPSVLAEGGLDTVGRGFPQPTAPHPSPISPLAPVWGAQNPHAIENVPGQP